MPCHSRYALHACLYSKPSHETVCDRLLQKWYEFILNNILIWNCMVYAVANETRNNWKFRKFRTWKFGSHTTFIVCKTVNERALIMSIVVISFHLIHRLRPSYKQGEASGIVHRLRPSYNQGEASGIVLVTSLHFGVYSVTSLHFLNRFLIVFS